MVGVGTTFRLRHLAGKRLQPKQAILAKCASCMNDWIDGRHPCEANDCPLKPWYPYGQEPIRMRKLDEKTKAMKAKILIKARRARRDKSGRESN
jgi:hypothetical protein